MKVFFTNYHISVNHCFVDDLLAIGHTVVMPSQFFANGRIGFFAPNEEHMSKKGVYIVNYDEFLTLEPMALVIPCDQLYNDMMKLYEARGKKDTLVYLTALSSTINTFPIHASDYIISHDMIYHRATKANYKVWYFNRPRIMVGTKRDIRKTFDEKKIKLYINNFFTERFDPERAEADKFKELWGRPIPYFGYDCPDGWLDMRDVQHQIVDSMFTLVFKRPETWGQMVNESMLLGTPVIMLRKFLTSTFNDYLINPDTAIICDTVEECIDRINSLSFEQYETLCNEARWMSNMFCNNEIRQEKLKWLFNKIGGGEE